MSFNPYPSPEEQLRQVMSWYPNKKLYKRVSSKSGKNIISVYSEDTHCPVYSHDEWYSNDWTSPFLELDFGKSFFEQFKALQSKAPVVTLLSTLQENAEYCQDVEGLKNCYLVFDAINCRDVYYSVRIYNSQSCVDVYWVMESELLYECVYMFSCYNCEYCFNCKQVSDSSFLFNCRNVTNSFMCSNLRNKEFCIYNKQHSKEEYEVFMQGIDLASGEVVEKCKKYFDEEILKKSPAPVHFLENCENVEGNYVKNAKDCVRCFESFDLRDCENVFQCAKGKNIYGSFMCNDRVEQCTQCVATGIGSSNVKNCAFVWHSASMEYCYLCLGCQDCFGCIGLRNKKYHILNKPYSKEEYETLLPKLIENMKKLGEYGLFFPMDLSPFHYEDTIAYDFFEGTDAQAPAMALNYTPHELEFYKIHKIPLPVLAFPDRYKNRLRWMDTSFELKKETYYKHPDSKNIVSEQAYQTSLS